MTVSPRLQAPFFAGNYVCVYRPGPDVYLGPDTPSFRCGVKYCDWVANDFTFLKAADGCLHAFGITHPKPPGFKDAFSFNEATVHEAESQFFHAVFSGSLRELYNGGMMRDCGKILWPQERPEEPAPCWAPAVFRQGDHYRMVYSPERMRTAVSGDLYRWETQGELFRSDYFGMRDPYVFEEGGVYYLIYNEREVLYVRTTRDFAHLSTPKIFQEHCFGGGACMESPCLVKRNGIYYLLWCLYDGQNGCYDNRTFVFASETLDGFSGRAPVAMLPGHAPELVCEDGEWYLVSVFYPENGLSVAKIGWRDVF